MKSTSGRIPDSRRPRYRRGVTLVEAAVVILTFLTLVLGMLDFALAVLNRNNLSAVARRLGRAAIIHGQKSSPELTPWGPATYQGTAASGGEIADSVKPFLAVMPASQVQIRLDWPDGSNAVGQRVQATVTYQQQMLFTKLFGMPPWTQQSVAVMRIQH